MATVSFKLLVSTMFLLSTFGYFSYVNSLYCWRCTRRVTTDQLKARLDSNYKYDCSDPFLNTTAKLEKCLDTESAEAELGLAACKKTIEKFRDYVTYSRSCDFVPIWKGVGNSDMNDTASNETSDEDPFEGTENRTRCTTRVESNGDFLDECYCRDRDGCNDFVTDIRLTLEYGVRNKQYEPVSESE